MIKILERKIIFKYVVLTVERNHDNNTQKNFHIGQSIKILHYPGNMKNPQTVEAVVQGVTYYSYEKMGLSFDSLEDVCVGDEIIL